MPPLPRPSAGPEVLSVFATDNEDEIGIRTLVGEYVEKGTSHGRKYYERTQSMTEDLKVVIYYWEDTDSAEFTGWWFGDQLGGSQAWSRNQSKSQRPPKSGWTIPWDGEVRDELCIMNKTERQNEERKQASARMQARRLEEDDKHHTSVETHWEQRVEQATEKCAEVEIDAKQALEMATVLAEDDVDACRETYAELSTQQKALTEVQRFVGSEAIAAKKAPQILRKDLEELCKRLRGLQGELKDALARIKPFTTVKAEAEDRPLEPQSELELAQSQQLEEMMPAVLEKVEGAEDEVEKVSIAAAPLQMEGNDDLRHVMLQAIKETEKSVRTAQNAIGEARRFLSGKLSQVGRFTLVVKKQAIEEFSGLQEKLSEAQKRLNPYKSARQDYEKRAQSKKLLEDLSSKLASAEIEVEKAAMMTAPLGGDNPEGVKETESALATAQSLLAQTNRLVDSKLRTAEKTNELLVAELKGMQERGKLAQEKLDEVRRSLKETQVRMAADALMKEVSDKVAFAEDELQKMAEAELPFLRNDKDQDQDALFLEADKVAVQVHSALAEAQSFVARKLVEVAKFSDAPGQTVREEVDMLQKRLEEGRDRLQQFRTSIAERKRSHLLEEVEQKVLKAEEEVKRMTEVTAQLPSFGKAGESVSEGLSETLEQANHAERAAQASVVTARKYLLQKTAELKKLAMAGAHGGSGGELGRLQTRVNNMQQDIAKLRTSIKEAEERLRVKQLLAEVLEKLHLGEEEVEKVAAAATPEQPSSEAVEKMEKANASAQMKLSTTLNLVEIKLKSAQGFLQEELTAMQLRIKKAEKKLEKVIAAASDQKERLRASELIAQCLDKADTCEAALRKASEAELPFLKGTEALSSAETQKAVADCEAAAAVAQKAITDARAVTLQNLAAAKEFANGADEFCTKDLLQLQKRLDGMAGKLSELKKETADRKRKAQLGASTEKVADVEAGVAKLAATMQRFSDDSLTQLSSPEARAVVEEISQEEKRAETLLTDCKKFLNQRVTEAKALAEAQRKPFLDDLSKIQARVTAAHVELAKLSRQMTEREQRYVALQLVSQAGEDLEKLRLEGAAAAKICETVLDFDGSRASLLGSLRLDAVSEALQGHLKSTNASPESLWEDLSQGGPVSKDQFGEWLSGVSEKMNSETACVSKEHAMQLFARVASKSTLQKADFEELLRPRRVCSVETPYFDVPEGGEERGLLYAGEAVDVIEGGGERLHCRLLRDGSTFWVSANSAKKTPVLKESSAPVVGQLASLEAFVKAVASKCNFAATQMEQKAAEVANVKQGPLLSVRNRLLEVKSKLNTENAGMDALRKKVSDAKAAAEKDREAEVHELREGQCKAFAEHSVRRGSDAVESAEALVEKATAAPRSAAALAGMGLAELEALKREADEALHSLNEAKVVVAKLLEAHDTYRGPSRNLLLQARVELTKLKSRTSAAERNCQSATEALRVAHAQVVKTTLFQAKNGLRTAFRKQGTPRDAAFESAVKGDAEQLSLPEFQAYASSLTADLTQEQVALLYREFGGKVGMTRPAFFKAVQEYATCIREVAMTEGFTISSSSTVRKIQTSELVEVLAGPEEDEESKVRRVRCRALKDAAEGWVTIKGNQGTAFLKPREKPFLVASGPTELREASGAEAVSIRSLEAGEKLELLEGPREVAPEIQLFLKGAACKDAAQGFICLQELSDAPAPSDRYYVCKSVIAMTQDFDLTNCKPIRKVSVGEALELLESDESAPSSGSPLARLRFRALQDGREGWVTLKGNQGTVYLEQSKSHYLLERSVSLKTSVKGTEVLRQLEAGEVFEAKGNPVKITPQTCVVMRARSLMDWREGWISFVPGPSAPIKPFISKAPQDQ